MTGTSGLALTRYEYSPDKFPAYAILSHTWGNDDEEVTLHDVMSGTVHARAGYQKIRLCQDLAAAAGYRHLWVDTCCIDKSNQVELTEAINSMYRWYQNAVRCYVYLADVSVTSSTSLTAPSRETCIARSRWFTRGWTLQELIAPRSVEFYSREGIFLGDKVSLKGLIHEITQIPISVLEGAAPPSTYPVEKRFSWAAKRQTKRGEDMAYSLLGIFDVFMPLIYGEGQQRALSRLRREIDQQSSEQGRSVSGESYLAPTLTPSLPEHYVSGRYF